MGPAGAEVFRRGPVHMPFGVYVCTRSRQWGVLFRRGGVSGGVARGCGRDHAVPTSSPTSTASASATSLARAARLPQAMPPLRRLRNKTGSLSTSAWREALGAAPAPGPLSLFSASQIPIRTPLACVGGVVKFAANEDGRRPAWHAVRPGTQRQGAYHAATEHRPSTRTEPRSSRGHNACRRSGSR